MGTRLVKPSLPTPAELASRGIISPVKVRATAAANRMVSTARWASTVAVAMGLADSAVMVAANSSMRSASAAAVRSRISARWWAGMAPARWRWSATATARSRSSVVQAGTWPTSAPS